MLTVFVITLAVQVKVNLVSAEAERICIDRMVKGQEEPFSNPEGLAEIDSRMASLVSGTATVSVENPQVSPSFRTCYVPVFWFYP